MAGLTKMDGSCSPAAAGFVICDKPPKTSMLRSEEPTLLVVVPPGEGTAARLKMYQALQKTVAGCPEVEHIEALCAESWRLRLDSLPAAVPFVKEREPRLVLVVVGLPPGGGKSTFFRRVQEILGAMCQVVSSDEERAEQCAFDDVLRRAVKHTPIVCYDKNIPNGQGIAKLAKVLGGLLKDFDIQVVLLAPPQLTHVERDCCWARVLGRAEDDVALTTHIEGGEAKAWSVFNDVFFSACANFLPEVLQSGAAIATDVFWNSATSAVEDLVVSQRWAEFPDVPAPGSVNLLDMPFVEGTPARQCAWASAEIKGTALHVTLVPPNFQLHADPPEKRKERAKVMERLSELNGQMVNVTVAAYQRATKDTDATDFIGVWEVTKLEGLPEDAQLPEQRSIYHITDIAALSQDRRPKAAAELTAALRGVRDGGHAETELCREVCEGLFDVRSWRLAEPLLLEGVVTVHE